MQPGRNSGPFLPTNAGIAVLGGAVLRLIAAQKLESVCQHGQHELKVFANTFPATGEVDDQRLPSNAGDGAADHGHGGVLQPRWARWLSVGSTQSGW